MKPTRRNALKSFLAAIGASLIPVAVLFRAPLEAPEVVGDWIDMDWDGTKTTIVYVVGGKEHSAVFQIWEPT